MSQQILWYDFFVFFMFDYLLLELSIDFFEGFYFLIVGLKVFCWLKETVYFYFKLLLQSGELLVISS